MWITYLREAEKGGRKLSSFQGLRTLCLLSSSLGQCETGFATQCKCLLLTISSPFLWRGQWQAVHEGILFLKSFLIQQYSATHQALVTRFTSPRAPSSFSAHQASLPKRFFFLSFLSFSWFFSTFTHDINVKVRRNRGFLLRNTQRWKNPKKKWFHRSFKCGLCNPQ